MGGRQGVLVVFLAIGRGMADEARAVPGGDAGLVVIVVHRRVVPDAVDLIGIADLVRGPGRGVPGDGLGLLDDIGGLGTPCQKQAKHQAGRAKPHHVVLRVPPPTGACRLPADEAIRKQADRGGEEGRAVPLHDRLEVPIDQKGRARGAVGRDQGGGKLGLRQGAAVRVADAQPLPFAEGLLDLETDQGGIDAGGQADGPAPGLVGPPMEVGQVIGDGGEDIRLVGPDVPPPVTVEIHGIVQEARGHELALAHGPGPGSRHARGRHIAVVDDPESIDHLAAEHRRAAAAIGQGRQRPDHGIVPRHPPVVGFHGPERHDEARLHAIGGGNPLQQRRILLHQLAAVGHPLLAHHLRQVLREGHGEFGLVAILVQHVGHRAQPRQGGGERRLGDALGPRVPPEALQPIVEGIGPRGRAG